MDCSYICSLLRTGTAISLHCPPNTHILPSESAARPSMNTFAVWKYAVIWCGVAEMCSISTHLPAQRMKERIQTTTRMRLTLKPSIRPANPQLSMNPHRKQKIPLANRRVRLALSFVPAAI